jgi:hypothetical protein
MYRNICSACLVLIIVTTACHKNLTKDFADLDAPGLTIFSDKGNNILSCYINGKPWKTTDRILYNISTHYELYIYKTGHGILQDTLTFAWEGQFINEGGNSSLKLVLHVKKDFNQHDFSLLEGQRITIDSTSTGYFSTNADNGNMLLKGNGSIYFHKAVLDSTGRIAGLFETTINGIEIKKGRFDEDLDYKNVNFD